MPARTSPASRRIALPAAAWRAPSRSCSPSPAFRCGDNILVGAHLRHRSRAAALAVADTVGREVGLGDWLDRPAHTLTVAGRKRLELARALATEPKLLLLDEVLAGLNPSEIRDIVPVIRAISARGVAVVMIEHVMQAVMSLSERIFVLAEGRIIAEGTPGRSRGRSGGGRSLSRSRRGGEDRSRPCPLSRCSTCRSLRAGYGDGDVLCGVDLKVDAGEIVAVLGSNGVGKSTLNRAISGVVRARSGTIRFAGAAIERERPAAIVARGLIHVPEGRRIFPNLSVDENLDLGSYRRAAARRVRQPRARVRDLPAPARAPLAARRHPVGRRAADARHRPRPDGGAAAPHPRRAFARACRRSWSRNCSR